MRTTIMHNKIKRGYGGLLPRIDAQLLILKIP